jgi:hypothetical protein
VAYIAEKVTPARTQLATTQQAAPRQSTSQQATAQQATPAPIRTADAAAETALVPVQPNPAIPSQPNPAKSEFKNFSEIGALEDGDTIALPKLSATKPREKEEDESKRLKRVMSICSGC